MNNEDIRKLIANGEDIHVEFKKSTNDITKDVYDTVCSFSNRDGGHILLGVRDDGTVLGVDPEAVSKIKKNFVTAVNNKDKIFPPMYLNPEQFNIDGKTVIYIYVPSGNQVCRHSNRIYDRVNESDIDITNQPDAVYQLYARKNGSYFINKITGFGIDSLRVELIERARRMAVIQDKNHPWQSMTDEQILRSAGLILEDGYTHQEGITLAGILLFGKDSTIMSALPQHKTDAIFRVQNVDRYDDRDVIITNLLDSYDRLMAFGAKHLSDPFVLDGVQRVSARDNILREIFSNTLAHRDYSSGYVAKFVIEKDQMYTENANRPNGYGMLQLSSFTPYAKNPAISKVFREIGLADELGSGMRNTYKYTKMYSGGEPEFIEGDMFRTIIPLTPVSVGIVGPESELDHEKHGREQDGEHVREQDREHVGEQDETSIENKDAIKKLLEYCSIPRSRREMQEFMGLTGRRNFTAKYIKPLLDNGRLVMTIPDKPKSRYQKYFAAEARTAHEVSQDGGSF